MPLGRHLLECGVIDSDQLAAARSHRRLVGGTLDESLLTLGHLTRGQLDPILDLRIPEPQSIEETRLEERFLLDFLLKAMYLHGLETEPQIADFVHLSHFVVDELLEILKAKRLVEILGLAQDTRSIFRYALTDAGRHWASEALDRCQYTGPAPVPLALYQLQVEKQSVLRERVSRNALVESVSHLVLPAETLERLGPALTSASAILLYGPPGNGKTSIAEALVRAFEQDILVPHCFCVDGQIVKVFDPTVHEPVAVEEAHTPSDLVEQAIAQVDGEADAFAAEAPDSESDRRWVRCRRPVVVTAGELTLEMLDLRFEPIARFYEAPAHVKAMGGVFVIDDFGRQRLEPQDLVNRWIMPLENRRDLLTLHNGKKIEMPFDQLLVFSTNFPPDDLMDPAGLRRIPYKFYLDAPSPEDYAEILRRVAKARGLEVPEDVVSFLLEEFYPASGKALSAAHPAFLVDHTVNRCRFDRRTASLAIDVVREATENLTLRS